MKKNNYLKIITPIIKRAGENARKKWLRFNRSQSVMKSQTQIVTAVDRDTEKELIKQIKKYFPSHGFLGEEYGYSDKKSDFIWIIDPIDGTTNFSIHNPLWSISIGLAYKGEIIFGIIYVPVLEELFWANIKQGAYLNGLKIKPHHKSEKSKQIHTFCHGSKKKDLKLALEYYRQQKLNALDCRQLGSAAIELAYVATGRVDSIIIPGANIWDVAAGALIAQEAGIMVTDFKGNMWNLKSHDIAAARSDIMADILKKIQKLKS